MSSQTTGRGFCRLCLALRSTPPTGFVRFTTHSTDLGEGARCGSNRGARAGRPAPGCFVERMDAKFDEVLQLLRARPA